MRPLRLASGCLVAENVAIVSALFGVWLLCHTIWGVPVSFRAVWGEPSYHIVRGAAYAMLIISLGVLVVKQRSREIAEAKFRGLIEYAPDAMLMINRKNRIEHINSSAAEMFGYTSDQLTGKPIDWLIADSPLDKPDETFAAQLARVRSKGAQVTLELVGRCQDGINVPVEMLLRPFETPDDLLVMAVLRDISERRQTEAERAQLAAIVETSNDAIVSMTPDGIIHTWNPGASRLYGYTEQQAIGQPISLLVPPDRSDAVMSLINRIKWGERVFHYDTGHVRSDGTTIEVALTLSAILNGPGKIASVSMIARDITERKRAEVALRKAHMELESRVRERTTELSEANRTLQEEMTERRRLEERLRQSQKLEAVGRLAGGVAHDFNNLLTGILGYAEILLSDPASAPPTRKGLEEIKRSGQRAAALVRRLMAFGRKQTLLPRVMDLNSIVSYADKDLRRTLGGRIELDTRLESQLWPVEVDPGQIEQVLITLASNAHDAMPDGGKLALETTNTTVNGLCPPEYPDIRPGSYVRLTVSDTGCGMTDEVKSHLFEPFFTTKDTATGTGLGLATVYGIVKQSGGQIAVNSEVGKGTTFHIFFPRVKSASATLDKAPAA